MANVPPPMPASTANWHWKNKNVTPWAKTWFERELTTLTVKGDNGEEASISEVVDVEGDVELGQRKSKYVSIPKGSMYQAHAIRLVDSSRSMTARSS